MGTAEECTVTSQSPRRKTVSQAQRRRIRERMAATGENYTTARRALEGEQASTLRAAWDAVRAVTITADSRAADHDARAKALHTAKRALPGRFDLLESVEWDTDDQGFVLRPIVTGYYGPDMPAQVQIHAVAAAAIQLGVDVDLVASPGGVGASATLPVGDLKVRAVVAVETDGTGIDLAEAERLVAEQQANRPWWTIMDREHSSDLADWRFEDLIRHWFKSTWGAERDDLRRRLDARAATEDRYSGKWTSYGVPEWFEARDAPFDEDQARRLRANANPCPTCGRWWNMDGAAWVDYDQKCPRGHHRPRPVEPYYPPAIGSFGYED
jgi:hypothetical protein